MTRRALAALAIATAACGTPPAPPQAARPHPLPHVEHPDGPQTPAVTDDAIALVHLDLARQEAEERATRKATTTTTSPRWAAPDRMGDAFWQALSNCESPTGEVGRHVGYFQFSWDTAAKVGIDGTEPYEEQKAAAIEWARRIHPNEGTRSGWPHCWWQALEEVA
jgi:hypothetical protein